MKKQRSISAKKARAAAHKMRKPRATSKPARKKSAAAARSKSLPPPKGLWVSRDKMDRVLDRLREAQETLNAIRSGDVDAVVVTGSKGNHVYTLTSAEQPYRVFVEHMQEGALTVSAGGIILYCNKRFAEMANLPLERVISAKISDFITIQAWDVLAEVFNKSGRSVKCEDVLQSRGRRILSVTYTASLIPMDEQKVMCLVVTDLTQQREHENLRLAKDLAEKASLAKDSFLATLSHELRTPLTPALITSISLEENEELPESLRQDVSMIRRNIELEARLIDDLLDLTRISHGKFEIALAPMDVHAVLNRVIEICRSTIDAKRQRLQVEFGAKNPLTMGDGIRLQQVFWNIIRNAVKFTPQEGTITIATSNTEKEIRIAIADTGIGFEAESAPKLFHAFEQAGRDITRQFGGLGLGLAISRSIVDAHGGRITATSEGI
ncbi:MAG TPA: PAS domain-containing sensor histidine kinase, partial [Chthoniobacteraceae bacterium]|nr:PAS domain-containing sensor histidine kinase [Chthoniobacteraceae bacterium]